MRPSDAGKTGWKKSLKLKCSSVGDNLGWPISVEDEDRSLGERLTGINGWEKREWWSEQSGERAVSLEMVRLEMGGTKGGAGALRMQIALSFVQFVISLSRTRIMRWPWFSRLQEQWRNCIKDEYLFGWTRSHKVVDVESDTRTRAASANNNMEYVGRRQEVPESGPGNG